MNSIEFYGKLTQEEIDKIDQSKGEIFLDFPCPKCGGEVGHIINCPDGAAFSDEGKMAFCRRMKSPKREEKEHETHTGTDSRNTSIRHGPWGRSYPKRPLSNGASQAR